MVITHTLHASLLKKPTLSHLNTHRKSAVPSKKGFEQPTRTRSTFPRPRSVRRFFRRKSHPWKLSARRRWGRPRSRTSWRSQLHYRSKRTYRVGYWRRPLRRLSNLYARRLHFYQQYTGNIRRNVLPLALARRRTYFHQRRTGARQASFFTRTQKFWVIRIQPSSHRQRFRYQVLRRVVQQTAYISRKTYCASAVRSSFTSNRAARGSARDYTRAIARQRLYNAQRRSPLHRESLRLLRLFAAETRSVHRAGTVGAVTGLRWAPAKALYTRVLRRNKRRTTGFFFDRRAKGKRRRIPRRLWRQGRRGYAGLFGKRRYRIERRDKKLIRRNNARLVLRQLLFTRTVKAQEVRRGYTTRSVHRKIVTASRSLQSTSSAKLALLAARMQLAAYVTARNVFISQQRRRNTRRSLSPSLKNRIANFYAKQTARARVSSFRAVSYGLLRTTLSNKKSFYTSPWTRTHRQWRLLRARRGLQHGPLANLQSSRFAQLPATFMSQSPSMLDKVSRGRARRTMPIDTALLKTHHALWDLKKTLFEKRFYAGRPRMRLPQTVVTRRRRRKGGLGLFTQSSLRAPKTLVGLRNLLLTPSSAVSKVRRRNVLAADTKFYDLSKVTQRADARPQYFARRRLRWIDLAPAFWVTYSASARSRRRRLGGARRAYKVTSNISSTARLQKLDALSKIATKAYQTNLSVAAANARRTAYVSTATPFSRSSRTLMGRKSVSRSTRRLLSVTATTSTHVKRTSNVWHARSVRLMQQMERALSAWSPQYQTRWRRWASPRQDGILLRRAWPSIRTIRDRRRLNAALLRRHLPQRRYWDRSFIHLQYHHGSAASIGYTRLRRAHRLHSNFSRWWRPITYSVPFVHPYSRRSLNAKRYYQQALCSAARAQSRLPLNVGTAVRVRPMLRMERHMISRKIPWRNFNYPTPRRGAPTVIQRWTMRYKGRGKLGATLTKSHGRTTTMLRTPRELRQLEQKTFGSSVISGHQWVQLDPKTCAATEMLCTTALFRRVPSSVWLVLRQKSKSTARFSALQQALLSNYRQWAARLYEATSPLLPAISDTQSTRYLLSLMQTILSSTKAFNTIVRLGVSLLQQQQLRHSATTQKIKIKRDTYWRRRELPAIAGGAACVHMDSFARENSHLHKRWLRGAEQFMRSAQHEYIPVSRSRYSPNFAINFGRSRMRFPAAGRRKRSFDSMLHAFARRTSPARFRRAGALRFVRPLLRHTVDYRESRLLTAVSAPLQRQRFLSKKLNKTSTLTTSWREVLQQRVSPHVSKQNAPGVSAEKRRFIPLPTKLLAAYRRRIALIQQPRNTASALRAIRSGVLRYALRRRRSERAFIDLRKAVLQRRTPRERALRPGKLRWRARLRVRGRAKSWRKQRTKNITWGLSHLGTKGARLSYRPRVTKTVSPSGELLLLPQGLVRRSLRAVRGFSIVFNRRQRRLRRKIRDSRKGRRGRRRRSSTLNPRQAVLLKTHWSEGKDLRGFRRLSRRPYRAFTKRFLTAAPKLFGAAYGQRRSAPGINSCRRITSAYNKFVFNTTADGRAREYSQQVNALFTVSSAAFKKSLSSQRRKHLFRRRPRHTVRGLFTWRKAAALLRQRVFTQGAHRVKRELHHRAAQFTGCYLIAAMPDRITASPLHFQNPTTKVVKSEGAKSKEQEADIASKEDRYKLTAQYVENLTRFIPELINSMVSKRIIQKHSKVTLDATRELIKNIYWSLRIYLNVDPFDVRFTLRDRNPSVRVRMSKLMDEFSALQRTEQPQRAALRFRFQPARLLRLRNKLRFRGDWLRNFLPAKHALYLENSEEYGLFLLRTQQIRRLRGGPRGVASWKTSHHQIAQETRARQLLSLRYSRATPRFETMLQGTRRVPDIECSPLVTNRVRLSTNFFARAFSTNSRYTALVGQRLRQQARLVLAETSDAAATPFVSVVNRYRVLPRVESRGRTSYVGATRPSMTNSFLDARALRTKSPRSRQYLVRTGALAGLQQLQVLNTYRRAAARLVFPRTRQLTRNLRRFSHPSASGLPRRNVEMFVPHTRAVSELLSAEQDARSQKAAMVEYLSFSTRRAVHPRGWARLQLPRQLPSLNNPRSVLHNRSAQLRSAPLTFRAATVLPPDPITVFDHVWRRWYWAAFRPRRHPRRSVSFSANYAQQALMLGAPVIRRRLMRVLRLQRQARAKRRVLLQRRQKLKARMSRLQSKFTSTLSRTERLALAYLPEGIAKITRKLIALHREYKLRQHACYNALEHENNKLQKSKHHLLRPPARANQTHVGVIPSASASYPFFFVDRGGVLSTLHLATRFCAHVHRTRQQTPFDSYRARLWSKLTLRRMKKERIIRYWIKGTSRWMRDPWIANIVSLDLRSQPGRLAGELRPIEQQIGEYVPDVDARGKDIPYTKARALERHKYSPRPQPKLTEVKLLSRVRGSARFFVRQRLEISKSLRRKPIPAMWLANYEYNDFWREFKEEAAKPLKQKREEAKLKQQEALARTAQGLPLERKRRYALKMPPFPQLPKIIWKEIHRRARRLEWRESDEVFFRKGFRNAFRFYPAERNRAPWLEALMYTRATFSTRLREFRRRQFPREQKKFKWLQRVRKALFSTRTNRYVRGRRWSQLRIYNQRLHRSLFNLPDQNAARRHFRKLNRRTRPAISSFVEATRGLGDRLDVTLMYLKVAPSIFWARVVAPFGLLRVNGVMQTNPAYRIKPGALIQLEWERIARFRHFFTPNLSRREAYQRRTQRSTSSYPTNFEYHRGTRTIIYKYAPDEKDLRRSDRLRSNLFRWFKLDSL